MEAIPKCKMCGGDLYEKQQLFYDKRRKYCSVCAEWRKRNQDANRMKDKRRAEKNARTEKIKALEITVEQLNDKNNILVLENQRLRNIITSLRESKNY